MGGEQEKEKEGEIGEGRKAKEGGRDDCASLGRGMEMVKY